MKVKNILLFCALACITAVSAQPQNEKKDFKRPSIEEMQNAKWTFMVQRAQLSEKEQQAVKPIYTAYEHDFWNLHKRMRDKRNKCKLEDFTETDFQNANRQIVEFEIEKAQLLKRYNEQLEKILSPRKIFFYYGAEKDYRKRLIEQPPKQHPCDK